MADIIDINAIKAERERLEAEARASKTPDMEYAELAPEQRPVYANKEEAERLSPDLKEMNEKYAFIVNYGGKPAIKITMWSEVYNKHVVEYMLPDSLITVYANRIAEETKGWKTGRLTIGKWWLAHPYRNEYQGVTFEPDKAPGPYIKIDSHKLERAQKDDTVDVHVSYFNAWEGLSVKPKKGSWKKFRRHIYVVLCNKDKRKFKYVIKWFAWAVQNPGKTAQVALIFKGKKGAGKGVILQAFVDIFGRHGLTISNREHLTGKHNQHLATCSFLYADEAYHPGDKEVEGILKNLITEPTLTTEPKFRELRTTNNCLHIAMATNADWVIPATEDERRYFINEVDSKWAKGQCSDTEREEYFNGMWAERENEGLAAMLYDLLKIDLTNWHPRNSVPETEELRRQIAMSLPKLKFAFMRLLEDGIFPGSVNGDGEHVISNKNLLEYIHNIEPGNKSINSKALSKLCVETLGLKQGRKTALRYYIFPQLGELREVWNQKVGKNTDWRTNEKWEIGNEY